MVLLRERSAGLLRRADEDAAESGRMRERLTEVSARERDSQSRLAELRAALGTAQADAEAGEQALGAVESELRQRRLIAADHKQLSLELFSAEADKRGTCERVRERQTALAERLEVARGRRAEIDARLGELGRVLAAGEGRRAELEAALDQAVLAHGEVERMLEALAAEAREAEAALARRREDQAAAESRLSTLLDLKRNFEGVSEGVKALFEGGEKPAGVIGMIADVLEVPQKYLDALEASLGEASAFVLVESHAALEGALGRLRHLESGRATLIDVSSIGAHTPHPTPAEPGVLGRASDLVRCDSRHRALVDRLLGSVIVVEDRATASRLAAHSEGGLRFVSLDGEVWERGRVRAGSLRNLSGLLHREMQIRELSGQVAELSLGIEGLEGERAGIEARRGQAVGRRAAAQAEVDARRDAIEKLAREIDAAGREAKWAETESGERGREIEGIEAELETLAHALRQAEEDLAAFQNQLGRARAELAELDGAVSALEARREEAAQNAAAGREGLLRLSRDAGEHEAQWARAEQTRRELEAGLESRATDERDARQQVASIEAEVTGLSAGLTGLLESEASQRERVVELQRRMGALKEEVAAGETLTRQRRFEQTELAELLHQLELSRIQTHQELELTFERLRTEYQMDPAQWTPAAPAEGWDPEEASKRLAESRERFRGLGVVNLLALEEYSKKKERYTFLVQQRLDLTSARTQLLEAIEKINVTASELFRDTFSKVQGHFRDIFKTLFEGGDCELRMVGEDPLECEIEIAAKPRGKHLQSISLMSGGERALTAIALLFAIYLVKPSPFCLLDEVDAPLDDANVERFLRMLDRFSDKTQFVVITHNKKTMESARCLYGVTMQELGVSKLVSVRFDGQDASSPGHRELVATADRG